MSYANSINHQKYDSVFKIVFNDPVELLELYNALADSHHTDSNEITINTLEDAVFIGIKNDLSFIVNGYMNLYEHQSTMNPNMPLRGLYYLSDLYKQYYNGDMLHHTTPVKLFTPRFIVFYNGVRDIPEHLDLHLSDLFIHPQGIPDLEVVAHVININPGHNQELLSKCHKLEEYSHFSDRIRAAIEISSGTSSSVREQTVLNAIDSCIKDGILADILRKERLRIMSSVLAEFDAEKFEKYVKKVSYEEGFDEGHDAGALEITISLYLKDKITKADSIDELHMSESDFDAAVAKYQSEHS